jgi:hypothetical protein
MQSSTKRKKILQLLNILPGTYCPFLNGSIETANDASSRTKPVAA